MRTIIFSLIIILLFSFSSLAADAEKLTNEELRQQKIEREIERLEKKKDLAKTETRKKRIQDLIDGHKATLNRSSKKTPSVRLENVSIKMVRAKRKQDASYFLAGAGIAGGALMLSGGYVMPVIPGIGLLLDTGVGIGGQFNIIKASVGTIHKYVIDRPYYYGINLVIASFTNDVANVPGRGSIDQGVNVGAGIFSGSTLGPYYWQVGYNTCLGITGAFGYKIIL